MKRDAIGPLALADDTARVLARLPTLLKMTGLGRSTGVRMQRRRAATPQRPVG